jgi:hypothetical protein
MNTTFSPSPLPQTTIATFLDIDPRQPRRRTRLTLDEDLYQEVLEVADAEGLDFSAAAGALLEFALRYYKFKRGTLNASLPQNSKTFYCQICGQLTSMRRLHKAQVLNEEYQFCELCFFAEKHKIFIITLVNRL